MKKEKKTSIFKRLEKFMGKKKKLFPIALINSALSAMKKLKELLNLLDVKNL